METKKYAQGLFAKRNDKAPDFVVCSLSVKVEEFNQFLIDNVNDKGYVNLQVLKNKEKGSMYAEVDTFEPKPKQSEQQKKTEPAPFPTEEKNGDLPF